ncbi:MAG TPA: alkaline phosphatase D family protein [Prosthecobacter sp.]|nr:alkaline phosphatase D family protein [Prosthecobacter sp.]
MIPTFMFGSFSRMLMTPTSSLPRRDFLTGALALGASTLARGADEAPAMLGPILGHSDETSAMVWMRAAAAGEFTLEVTPEEGGSPVVMKKVADEKDDLCLHWKVAGLQPGARHRYRILQNGKVIAADAGQILSTAPAAGKPAKVRLAISSCAKEDAGSRAVWNRMASENVDAVVLIGDTPYIDSTELEKQARRHREFAAVPEYQALLKSRPSWWTWDDHDFAGNDASGLAAGKENTRLVFTRYRPQKSYGDGTGGIYTSFRRGPVEVFLLDTRWFSMTEPSFAGSHKPTLLGAKQWEWLQKGLLASTAPFKLLACGVIWDDKENTESDDWGTYKHELTAIQKFIGENKIPGIILIGGDIHASRVLKYKTAKTVGYDLVQFIASPIHGSTIPSLNVYHPDLVRSAVEPNVFLRVDADSTVTPATFHAALINKNGETVFSYHLTEEDLKPKA